MSDKTNPPLPGLMCKACGHSNEDYTSVRNKNTPKPGAVTVCSYCGLISRFTEDLKLRKMTVQEFGEMSMSDPIAFDKVIKAVAFIKDRIKNN